MAAKVAVIVAAAGASTRFGGKVKKPFAKIDGRAVMLRTLELFVNRDDVCQLLLAVGEDDYDMVQTKYGANLGFMGIKMVKGGPQRWQTVQNALAQVTAEADLVAVHDAVRPCLTAARITDVFSAAERSGAAILAAPIDETLKLVGNDGVIESTLDRRGRYVAQTPQVFKREWIVDAYARLTSTNADPTDDAQVLEEAGYKVTIVESDSSNLKITRQSDLKLADAIIKSLPRPKPKGPAGPWAAEQMW